jgi:hypothetical protein
MKIMVEHVKGQNRGEDSRKKGSHEERQDLTDTGGSQNASANRGGTTDLDDEALTVDRDRRDERGSGIATKREVTGSDYDGQLSSE